LGNNREVLSEEGQVLQKNRYYPFGLPMAYDTRGTDLQPFKYNGKELVTMHGLNSMIIMQGNMMLPQEGLQR